MDKYYKLAEFIKAAGEKAIEYAEEGYKCCLAHVSLGITPTDEQPEILETTDDSGYRAITLGDTRGNVSYDTHKRAKLFHKGCVILYSENSEYKDGKEIYKYDAFPPVEQIYKQVKALKNANYKSNKTSLFHMIYLNDNGDLEATKKYLSDVIERFADIVWNDKRSALDIIENE